MVRQHLHVNGEPTGGGARQMQLRGLLHLERIARIYLN